MANGILIAAMDFSNMADELNDWYDTKYIPERERVQREHLAHRLLFGGLLRPSS